MTATAYKLPVLVDCEPYRARLTKDSCVNRWRKAKKISRSGKGIGPGNRAVLNGQRRAVLVECVGCEVGERRAKELGDDA